MSNINVTVQDSNNLNVEVTPTPAQTINIYRGMVGPAGPNSIAGYGFEITDLTAYDVLMFGGSSWVNTPQTEVTDGGNF